MTDIITIIKEKALQDFKTSGTWYGAHEEIINNRKVQAFVSKRSKNMSRSVYCDWYLDNKRSSLAKILEAIK